MRTSKQSSPRDQKNPCQPVLPVAPYIGGKRNLAKRIIPLIDADPHTRYCEVFTGMGGIFFRRTRRPAAEFINDWSRDVATLFRILQRHYPQFLEILRFTLTTRTEFERLVATDADTLTDLERAARFLYLQRTSFACKVVGRTFGTSKDRRARFNLTTVEPMLEDVHSRLSGVTIERLDFADFIRRYDSSHTFFYLDPPYWGVEGYYGKELFSRDDFKRLKDVLSTIKGRFLMSINDTQEVRDIFQDFEMVAVPVTYSASTAEHRSVQHTELLIGAV